MPARNHGASQKESPLYYEYQIWKAIKRRCYLETCTDYKDYGAKGITVCEAWKKDFTIFINDMGPRLSRKYSIDRINGKMGYTKDNCRWATHKEQSQNRECIKMIKYKGEEKSLVEWAKLLGIKRTTLQMRFVYGWTIEKAFSTKVGG